MKAAWYERQGAARDVLKIGERETPVPGAGEVRIKVAASGINPGEVKKRSNAFGVGMPYPLVIPHSDGAGIIDEVGQDVDVAVIGSRVWCFGAQSYRPYGTAAEYVVVPYENAIALPGGVSFAQGACLGIPGITAHRAIHVAGNPERKVVLVRGAGGAVGSAAVALAKFRGARVYAAVRRKYQVTVARRAGADHVFRTDELDALTFAESVLRHAPGGVDHIVEVAFSVNIDADERLLKLGGSIAAFATVDASPVIPFWPLVFKNITVHFLGSDDFSQDDKADAAADIIEALESGWKGFEIGGTYSLDDIAAAHEAVEQRTHTGRVVIDLS